MTKTLEGTESQNKKIVLHVISAYGFSLVKGSITILATLMNKKLETVIPAKSNELKINKKMTWHLDTHALKDLKMSNSSIKIDCIHTSPNKSTEKLGYLLINLKEAQTVDLTSTDRIENKSYKLIGSKNGSYSLKMSFTIEDFIAETVKITHKKSKHLQSIDNKSINDNTNRLEEERNTNSEENENFNENIETDLLKNDNNLLEQTEHLQSKDESMNLFTFDVQQKCLEELKEWKDKQMNLFNLKMEHKEEQLSKEFNKQYLNDKKDIEEGLNNEISKCKKFAENLEKMADMLKEREAICKAKELELSCTNDFTINKYNSFVHNFQNGQKINELSNKIVKLTTQLQYLEQNNGLLKKKNKQLKNDFKCKYGFHIREKQLKDIISSLESKLEEANQSCMLFKERWMTSVKKNESIINRNL